VLLLWVVKTNEKLPFVFSPAVKKNGGVKNELLLLNFFRLKITEIFQRKRKIRGKFL
jgi:hypothetical protein